MFLSRNKKFVFVRVPKTASTSGLFYFMRSGLYDSSVDLYAVDEPFHDWKDMERYFETLGSDYLSYMPEEVNCEPNPNINRCVHISYNQIISQLQDIDNSYACYSGIRNPIDRLCSVYYEELKNRAEDNWTRDFITQKDVNEFCYDACLSSSPEKLKAITRLQTSYFPGHARLWNTENFHEHAVRDIEALGGKVTKRIHVRDNNLKPKDYQALLSHEVVQMIELKYAQDFVLWEKAYAVYN